MIWMSWNASSFFTSVLLQKSTVFMNDQQEKYLNAELKKYFSAKQNVKSQFRIWRK